MTVHAGLLYGQGDYEGVRYSIREGSKTVLAISAGAGLLVLIFADLLAVVYGLNPTIQELGAQCLRIGCVAFPAIAFQAVFVTYLSAVDRVKLTSGLVALRHVLTIVAAGVGCVLGMQGFFACYVGAVWAAILVIVVLYQRNRFWFVPEKNPETIADYSIQLEPDQISVMSAELEKSMGSFGYPQHLCLKAAVVEDCMSYIAQYNLDASVSADIVLKRSKDSVLATIVDDGTPYNPLADSAEGDRKTPGTLEAIIVLGFSASVDYDRVLDLNYLSLVVKSTIAPRPS